MCGRFLPKLSNVECLKWRLKLLIAANKTLAGYILWVVLRPSCWWGDWGVIIAALTAPRLAGGGGSSALAGISTTDKLQPAVNLGLGLGLAGSGLATAGNYSARTRRWVTRKHEQSSNIQSIFPYSSIGNCIDTEDLIHSGQSWLFIFLAVAQVQYISGVIINGPVMSLLSLSNFTEQPSQHQE